MANLIHTALKITHVNCQACGHVYGDKIARGKGHDWSISSHDLEKCV